MSQVRRPYSGHSKSSPDEDVPSTSWGDVSHGRRVRHTVKAVEAPNWVDFP